MSDIHPLCDTCDYFNKLGLDDQGDVVGDCRRRAPTAVPVTALEMKDRSDLGELIPWCFWPRVWGNAWCGEHSKLTIVKEEDK
jgi:hypothetical protein